MTKAKLGVTCLLALNALAGVAGLWAYPPGDGKPARTDRHGDPLPSGALARLGTVRMRRAYQSPCDFAFTPDGKALVSARNDKVVQFWDVKTGKPLQELRHDKSFSTFVLSKNGKVLATAGREGITVWDMANRKQLRKIPAESVYLIDLASDSRTLAFVGGDGVIRLWDGVAGEEKRNFAVRTRNIHALLFAPNGKTLIAAVSTEDPILHVYDVASGREVRKITIGKASRSIALSPDGALLALGGSETVKNTPEARLFLLDMATGRQLRQLRGPERYVPVAAFSPDGQMLAAAEYQTIYLWDAATGKEVRRIENAGWGLSRLVFSPDGKTLASTGPGPDNTVVRLWDVATGKPLQPAAPDGVMRTVAFSPDGRFVATGSFGNDHHLRLWDAATGELLWACQEEVGSINRVLFIPEGKEIISSSSDGTIRLWDARTGKEMRNYSMPESGRFNVAIALSPDGEKLTTIGAGRKGRLVIVWNVGTGERLLQRDGVFPYFVDLVTFSPDTRIVAESNSKGLRLWKAAAGQPFLTLEQPQMEQPRIRGGGIREEAAAFSPDGQTLAAITTHYCIPGPFQNEPGEWAIHLWNLSTGKTTLRISGSENQFTVVAFSPDGRTLASAGKGVLQLWEAATGKEILAYRGQDAQVERGSLAFSPDSTRLAAGYSDSTALVWDLAPGIHRGGMPKRDFTRGDLDSLWSDLAGEDAAKAYAAIWTLAAAPENALHFLKERLNPVEAVDPRRIRRWLIDLDSAEFVVRESAAKELKHIIDQAEPLLRQALEKKPSLEVRRRIEGLLERPRGMPSPVSLRRIRAIAVLELIGTPEAVRLLEDHAKGAAAARATRDAKAALQRLARRAKVMPP